MSSLFCSTNRGRQMSSRVALLALLSSVAFTASAQNPEYNKEGQLLRPADYREWIFLSAGLGMTYGLSHNNSADPNFDNVFVNPSAYREFLKNGTWPDKTILMLEVRSSVSKGSINRGGHYQTGIVALEAHVKDGGKWAFYSFGDSSNAGRRFAADSACYGCHDPK